MKSKRILSIILVFAMLFSNFAYAGSVDVGGNTYELTLTFDTYSTSADVNITFSGGMLGSTYGDYYLNVYTESGMPVTSVQVLGQQAESTTVTEALTVTVNDLSPETTYNASVVFEADQVDYSDYFYESATTPFTTLADTSAPPPPPPAEVQVITLNTYYTVSGIYPFYVFLNMTNTASTYRVDATIDGVLYQNLDNTTYGTWSIGNVSNVLADGLKDIKVEVYEDDILIDTINSSAYFSSQDQAYDVKYIDGQTKRTYFSGQIYRVLQDDTLKKALVKDASGSVVMSSISDGSMNIDYNPSGPDFRYADQQMNFNLPFAPYYNYGISLCALQDLANGTYDLEITFGDDTTITMSGALIVTDTPAVTYYNTIYDTPMTTPANPAAYVQVNGINLDPNRIYPVIYNDNDEVVSTFDSWRYLYDDTILYKVNLTDFSSFSYKVDLLADSNYNLINTYTNQPFWLTDNARIYESYFNVDNTIHLSIDGLADGSYIASLVEDHFSTYAYATTTVNIINGEVDVDFEGAEPNFTFEDYQSYIVRLQAPTTNEILVESWIWHEESVRLPDGGGKDELPTRFFFNEISGLITNSYRAVLPTTYTDQNVFTGQLYDGSQTLIASLEAPLVSVGYYNNIEATYLRYSLVDQQLNPGTYTLKVLADGQDTGVSIIIGVSESGYQYVNYIYNSSIDNTDSFMIWMMTFNEIIDPNLLQITIRDILGNVVTGYSTNIVQNDYELDIAISNFTGNGYMYYYDVTYNGANLYELGNINVPYLYRNNENGGNIYNIPDRFGYEYLDGFYTGIYADSSAFPLTIKAYTGYDTDLVHSFQMTQAGYFTEANLFGLDLTRPYAVNIFDKNGKILGVWEKALLGWDVEDAVETNVQGVQLNTNTLSMLLGDTSQFGVMILPSTALNKKVSWTSSDPAVLSIDASGHVEALSIGTSTVTVTTEDGNFTDTCLVTVSEDVTKVREVQLNLSTLTLVPTGTAQLIATVLPVTALNQTVTWSNTNPEVISLDPMGNVTGLTVGTSTITVMTIDGAYTDTCIVVVTEDPTKVKEVRLNTNTLSMYLGDISQLIATVLPDTALNQTVTWDNTDPSVVSLDQNGNLEALNVGTATVTVTTEDGSYTDACVITVTEDPTKVKSVGINRTELAMNRGDSTHLIAEVLPASAVNKAVTWSSSDLNVLSIDSSGNITAVGVGTATITATTQDGGFTDSVTITVTERLVVTETLKYYDETPIALTNDSYVLDGALFAPLGLQMNQPLYIDLTGIGNLIIPGKIFTLDIQVNNTLVSSQSVTSEDLVIGKRIEFSRNDSWVDGTYALSLIFKDAGEVVSTVSRTMVIENTPIPVTEVNIVDGNLVMGVGETKALNVLVYPQNASDKTLTYTSGDENVALVSPQGLVTAVGIGTTTITAYDASGRVNDSITIDVRPVIKGTLLYGQTPASYTWVTLTQNGSFISRAFTNASGEFTFKNVLVGNNYSLSASSTNSTYRSYLSDAFSLTASDDILDLGNQTYRSLYSTDAQLTLTLMEVDGTTPYSQDVEVYLYGNNTNYYYYDTVTPDASGRVVLNNIPYKDLGTNYYLSVGTESYWDSVSMTIDPNNKTINRTFNIPILYAVRGKLLSDGVGIANEFVTLTDTNNNNVYYGYTDMNGNYEVNYLPDGTYSLGVYEQSKFIVVTPALDLTFAVNSDVTGKDISVIEGADLIGSVMLGSVTADRAYLSLYKVGQSGDTYVNGTSSSKGGFAFEGSLKEAGTYKIIVYSISSQGMYKEFTNGEVTFEVTDNDLTTGRVSQNIVCTPVADQSALSGEGNQVVVDHALVKNGDLVNLVIKYNNPSEAPMSAVFDVTLPAGVTVAPGSSATKTVAIGASSSGKFTIPLNIGDLTTTYEEISVDVTIDNNARVSFGQVTLEKIGVSLQGPNEVKVGEAFKIYGEATPGSKVVINRTDLTNNTSKIVATTTPSGRWYSASITPALVGNYVYTAQIESNAGGITAISEGLGVTVSADPLLITGVYKDGYGPLAINKVIGIPSFSSWVHGDLSGYDIQIETAFDQNIISSLTYHFSDLDFTATRNGSGRYFATLSGWYGAGMKTITATVVTTDNRTIEYTIAEVTALIDPSGIITDQETGLVLPGVEVVCQILNASSEWEVWDADSYGQVNPQTSDANGYYGWMVPAGTYRVLATKVGYEAYISTEDTINTNNNSIVIPPARDDVNFQMIPSSKVSSVSISETSMALTVGGNQTATLTVLPLDALNKDLITWSSSNTAVATVDASGKVTGVSAGNAVITAKFAATSGDITDTLDVTVSSAPAGGGGGIIAPIVSPTPETPTGEIKVVEVIAQKFRLLPKLEVTNEEVSLDFDKGALGAFENDKPITLETQRLGTDALSPEAKVLVGNRPVYEISIKQEGQTISNFNSGKVKVTLAYSLQNGEDANNILVFSVGSNGDLIPMISKYENGKITFITDHFSSYAVGYNKPDFKDVSGWYESAVNYLAGMDIIGGTSSDEYSPNKNITRAEIVQILANLSGETMPNASTVFSDVAPSSWYAKAVTWAYQNGIVSGVGEGKFSPNASVTRQDLCVMLNNYMSMVEDQSLPTTVDAVTFADDSEIATYAKGSVSSFQRAGIISGRGVGFFAPTANASRAEAAKIFELMIKTMFVEE